MGNWRKKTLPEVHSVDVKNKDIELDVEVDKNDVVPEGEGVYVDLSQGTIEVGSLKIETSMKSERSPKLAIFNRRW